MLEEAGYANELVLDILTGEQLTVLFGGYHSSRENADSGDFEYEWDSDNGNVILNKLTIVIRQISCVESVESMTIRLYRYS